MRASITSFIEPFRFRIVLVCVIMLAAIIASGILSPYDTAVSSTIDIKSRTQQYVKATVVRIHNDQTWTVKLLDGKYAGSVTTTSKQYLKDVKSGDIVILTINSAGDVISSDRWRVPSLVYLASALLVATTLVSGRKGLMSLAGLGFGILVISFYTIPAILRGDNAFITCVISAFVIGIISVYVSHGMNRRAAISVASISVMLILVMALSAFAVMVVNLSGAADDAAITLLSSYRHLDLAGVLAGGIVIATLGMLDDVVTTQVAAADEIARANTLLSPYEIFKRTMSVGNEHIAALINTLALAYIGVALPTVILIAASNSADTTLVSMINKEFIAQEIVRTLVSSIVLVLAVPISTAISILILKRVRIRNLLVFRPAKDQIK